jgi:Family of unknown function (DUF6494)
VKEKVMNEDRFNVDIRKFLKVVGVTSQREIETAVRGALPKGRAQRKYAAQAAGDLVDP